jgi:AcrR family transcriptional regulator
MTQQDIIEAAFRAWGLELYRTTSLTQLAQTLGVTKPALYRHFRNKEAVLEAMSRYFFDDFVRFTKPAFHDALDNADADQGFILMIRAIIEYYVRYPFMFVFSLVRIFGNQEKEQDIRRQYLSRGIDVRRLWNPEEIRLNYPSRPQLVMASITFLIALFHKNRMDRFEELSEGEIQRFISFVEVTVFYGLRFNKEKIDALDYEKLEKAGEYQTVEREDGLFKAVAEAVAEAGPWNASMEMVARRSGLSKSGLYAHFKSKQDMLGQLFLTEFDRIVNYAEGEMGRSGVREEQIYLAITAIAKYLQAKPEILIALDWIRTRRLEFGLAVPSRIHRLFADLCFRKHSGIFSGFENEGEVISQWILFLIVSTLMRKPGEFSFSDLPLNSFRILYRFIVLGIKDSN